MTGKVNPLIEKAAPVTFACEMVTDDPPVFVTVSDRFVVLPTWTLPNASVVGFAVSVPGVTPVPERGMFRLGLLPLDVMLTFPLAPPLALGAKRTVNDVVPPEAKVKGNVSPLKLKPVPFAVAAEIVRLDPPVFVSVSVKFEPLPTSTLPKARLVGFAASVPAVTPVPESGMLRLESEPVDVMLTLPVTAPATVGEKSTVNDVLWPAVNVRGNVSPLKLNPVPLAVAAVIVRLVPPELVRLPVIDFEVPSCTFPKLKLDGFDPN